MVIFRPSSGSTKLQNDTASLLVKRVRCRRGRSTRAADGPLRLVPASRWCLHYKGSCSRGPAMCTDWAPPRCVRRPSSSRPAASARADPFARRNRPPRPSAHITPPVHPAAHPTAAHFQRGHLRCCGSGGLWRLPRSLPCPAGGGAASEFSVPRGKGVPAVDKGQRFAVADAPLFLDGRQQFRDAFTTYCRPPSEMRRRSSGGCPA